MNATLLQTKLYLPIPRPDWLSRPRLTGILDGALQPGGRLVLISAPAGSGKTTLVADWLQRLTKPGNESSAAFPIYEPCWLSLDEGDNDLARFLVYLVAALERIAPGLGEGTLSLLRGPQQPPVESFLTVFINELIAFFQEEVAEKPANTGRLLLLALDDYHVIHSEPVHDAMAFLLDHLPGQMRLVLISRTEPPLPLARMRGRGQLLALDGADLRFSEEEALLFLNQVMGLTLSQVEVVALTTQTEGWIAGLQMAALASQRPGGRHDFARPAEVPDDQLAGSRLIMDYLLQEVLQSQPADLQAFLLQTSVLERLSAPLCDALTDQEYSQTLLAELERRNLFLFPLDQEGRWYRYHHLFAELLRQRLRQTQPERVPELHRRAAAWQQANGFMAEAIQHALAAGDTDVAASLVEQAADPSLMGGQFLTVLSWLSLLPKEIVRARPRLGVYQAFLMVLDGHPLVEVEATLRAAEEAATEDPESAQDAPATAETMLIRAVLAVLQGDLQTGAQLSRQAMALLPDDTPFLYSLALRNLASVHSMTGEAVAASVALTEAVSMAENMGDKTSLVLSLYSLARVYMQQARLHTAHEYLSRALSVGRDRRGRPLPVVARVLISLADIYREWNDLNEASRLAQDGIELTKQALAFWGISGYVTLSQIRQAEGGMVAAQMAIDTARELAVRFDATDLDDRTVELFQARLWLASGDVSSTARWANEVMDYDLDGGPRSRRPGQMAGWYVVHELEQMHLARLQLAQGRPEEARQLLEELRPTAENHQRRGSLIPIELLLALAWSASGDQTQALNTLEAALVLAEPEGYIRLFVDEGPAVATLLKQIPPDSPVADYAGRLLAAFTPVAALQTEPGIRPVGEHARQDPRGERLTERISEREMDVLSLLPTHLTSTEIAAELNISPNTARFHIKNIYSKLGVHNRAAAVAQAQQLGLIQ